jgi:hypothetical protein
VADPVLKENADGGGGGRDGVDGYASAEPGMYAGEGAAEYGDSGGGAFGL